MVYDLAIIGAGWAGFNAAIRAKALGLSVVIVEKREVGGTCLNRGCIPTKTLIQSAKAYTLAKKSSLFGIETGDIKVNFGEIIKRKQKIIQQLHNGMIHMLKGIDIVSAEAKIVSADTVEAGGACLKTRHIVIAVGSCSLSLKGLGFDGKSILSSDDILELREAPESLLVIGGGVIGCEFASLFSILGCRVSVVELMPQLLPGMDAEVSRRLEAAFKKKGIKVALNSDVTSLDRSEYERALVCIGRVADTQTLNLEQLGIKTDRSRIIVDEYGRTSLPSVYAAGDCASSVMLAHFAAYQGKRAAEHIAGQITCDNSSPLVPSCVFTSPEVASVGLTEDEARKSGRRINVHRFDFLGCGMAHILDETNGFIKIISDSDSARLLGAAVIGPGAVELIATLTLAAQNKLTVSQIQKTIFAHPSLSEVIPSALD